VASALAPRGEPIGTFDTLVAAHALACGVTLVANSTKHVRRVERPSAHHLYWCTGPTSTSISRWSRSRIRRGTR
jgi:hypothetical protein